MANKKKGFIPLYRSIQDHWLWNNNEPFSKGQAWIDLLLSVNHEEKKIMINNTMVTIKPGQRWTSLRTLAATWNWSKDRVSRYIKLLKSDGMITTDETSCGTLLTIVNWESYIIRQDSKRDTDKDTHKDTGKDTDKDTGKDKTIIYKNDNNDKECKEIEPAPPRSGGEWQ